MAVSAETFFGTWNVTLNDAGKVEKGQQIRIYSEKEEVWVEYLGERLPATFADGMLHTEFPNAETDSIFRVIIGYYEQEWEGEPWRSIFCLTVDTDPNDAGVWGAEETGNPA